MFGSFGRTSIPKIKAERKKELLEVLQVENTRKSEEAKKATAYCRYWINTYEGFFEWNEKRWARWQRVVIIGGVVATLFGAITLPESWITLLRLQGFGWVRGVPAAIVTIAAGFLGSFTYREDAVRHWVTLNSLWNELAKYQGQAEPYNENEADDTSLFLNNICKIVEGELQGWRMLVMGQKTEQKSGGETELKTNLPK
jgi:Protein of unknown function (DUF4231)